LTKLGPGFRYHPFWSPDSKKLVFIDQAMRVQMHDLDKKTTRQVARELWLYQDGLGHFRVSWSKDSRWFAFAQDLENRHSAVALYDTKTDKKHVITSGYYDDDEPVFDPDGKYLYYRSGREFTPVYGDLDDTWIYPNTSRLIAVPLRKDVPSPLAPRNDDEGEKKEKKDKPEEKKDADKEKKKPNDSKPKKDEPKLDDKKDDSNKDASKDKDKDSSDKKDTADDD